MENNYEVISTFIENNDDSYPTYLLGDTLKEAEEVFTQFKPYITHLANVYSKYSNVDKHDLFGEAILALGKAKKKYNNKLGLFTSFANFYIIDSMNECIRKYNSIITIPSHIYKINIILIKLKNILQKYTNKDNTIQSLIYNNNYDLYCISNENIKLIESYKYMINKKAINLKLTYKELIYELECLPITCDYDENDHIIDEYNRLMSKIVIGKLKNNFTFSEQQVTNLLMEGMKKYEIMRELNKSDSWVENKMKSIRTKLIRELT